MPKDIRKIVEEGYEKGDYAGKFRISSTPNEMERYFLDRLVKEVSQQGRVLDFGCGIGIPFDNYLIEKGLDVTGIDISQKHIEQAKKNVPQAKFVKGDFSKYDFAAGDFDAIISFYAIFHIPREEHQDLFSKMHTLLKESGVILITLGTSGSEYGEEQDWCGAPMAWSTYEPEEYKKIITNAGFKIVEEKYEGQSGDEEFHYWVIAKK
ncbi:MAG: class I SAM-dependent methyltransferase [Candidatus Spechtbacterales bacterium]